MPRPRAGLVAPLLMAAGCSGAPDAPREPSPSEARAVAEAKAMIPADEQENATPNPQETAAP